MISFEDEMNQIVTCKYCGGKSLYGELTWLNGKCMCLQCYLKEKEQTENACNMSGNDKTP